MASVIKSDGALKEGECEYCRENDFLAGVPGGGPGSWINPSTAERFCSSECGEARTKELRG